MLMLYFLCRPSVHALTLVYIIGLPYISDFVDFYYSLFSTGNDMCRIYISCTGTDKIVLLHYGLWGKIIVFTRTDTFKSGLQQFPYTMYSENKKAQLCDELKSGYH